MFSQFYGVRAIRNLGLAGLIVIVGLNFFGPCRRKPAVVPGKAPTVHTTPPAVTLAPDETKKIEVDTNKREVRYAIRKPDGTIEVKVIEGVRRATITEKKDGTVSVSAPRWGFCIEPGLGVAVDQGPRPAVDLRFFYFDRFGAVGGAYYRGTLRPYLALSYELSRLRLFNTSVWIGLNPVGKEVVFGARLGF